ncbi:MAG: DUF4956 domain-containing protein [Gemmatimonadales bacterium]
MLVGVVALLARYVPALRDALSFSGLEADDAGLPPEFRGGGGVGSALVGAGTVLLALVGALLLMIPVAWVYTITKQRQGYDQSVVQTLFLLPVTVAGVFFIVRHSVALAFGLAAIVAAVRFRNTLKDTKDTVYIFLAIGVGLAAGTEALALGAVMSLVFNVVILALWRFNIGNIYADQRLGAPGLLASDALLGPGRGKQALAFGDQRLLEAMSAEELDDLAERAARLQAYIDTRASDKKGSRFNALLLVHATKLEPAQKAVEQVVGRAAERWRLAEVVPGEGGVSTLEYLVRLKDTFDMAALLDLLKSRGGGHILAAEFKSLRGLKSEKGKGEKGGAEDR